MLDATALAMLDEKFNRRVLPPPALHLTISRTIVQQSCAAVMATLRIRGSSSPVAPRLRAAALRDDRHSQHLSNSVQLQVYQLVAIVLAASRRAPLYPIWAIHPSMIHPFMST